MAQVGILIYAGVRSVEDARGERVAAEILGIVEYDCGRCWLVNMRWLLNEAGVDHFETPDWRGLDVRSEIGCRSAASGRKRVTRLLKLGLLRHLHSSILAHC